MNLSYAAAALPKARFDAFVDATRAETGDVAEKLEAWLSEKIDTLTAKRTDGSLWTVLWAGTPEDGTWEDGGLVEARFAALLESLPAAERQFVRVSCDDPDDFTVMGVNFKRPLLTVTWTPVVHYGVKFTGDENCWEEGEDE